MDFQCLMRAVWQASTGFSPRSRAAGILVMGAVAMSGLAGCGGGGLEPALSAQPEPDGPVKNLFKLGSLATDPPKPKEFVTASRPDQSGSQYLPVHVRPPARPEPVLTATGVKQEEAALDAIRKRHDQLSGRQVQPVKPGGFKPRKSKTPPPESPAPT